MAMPALEPVLLGRPPRPDQLIEILLDVQEKEGFLSEQSIRTIASALNVPLIDVYRVASFYKVFSLRPRGKHLLTVCMGTACHVRGAPTLLTEARSRLHIGPGETTTDGLFSLARVNCVGACALGPIVILDGHYHHHMTPAKMRKLLRPSTRKAHGGKNP